MKRIPFCIFLCGFIAMAAAQQPAVKIDSNTFGEIKARSIGPAVMSGRVTDIDVVLKDINILYVGAANGGVWKSIDGGNQFKPVFDDHIMPIGCLTIDQNHPDTVWVGTGECNTRNSISPGAGIYRTTDGGSHWECMGLEDTEHIADILIDPGNSNVVYVAALGHLWNTNEDRGVYKTTDGGKSWERILYVDAMTGCSDLAMDPQEPEIIYAAMWQVRRWPYFFKSGGPGSGLYRTRDGGKNWEKLTNDLPEGELGRIAVEVAPARPSVVYATVEAGEGQTALYRSDDFGDSWEKMNDSGTVNYRPFYFSLLVADPQDYNRIYKTAYLLQASGDAGKSFTALGNSVHPDHHALWINPENTKHLICGTDGGVYVSTDRGQSWRMLRSLPLSQFYRVSADMQKPYNVYGGMQDNGSWFGPSASPNGIENKDWRNVGGGDGFAVIPDLTDHDILYSESQGGNISRTHLSTNESQYIRPEPAEGEEVEYRYNWNTPIAASPNEKGGIYIGSQFLFYSNDRGLSWTRLSPDLSTNDPEKLKQEESGGLTVDNTGAENHCTIFTISESPLNFDVIWAGTDDGNVQVTRDRGKTWTNVVKNMPDLPACTWCSSVEAGHFDEGTAYATFEGHRTGDKAVYVYKTTDFGKIWTSLYRESIEGYAHVIREDLVNPDLLFLGTERGLFVTIDGGEQWARFTGGLPPVSVKDLVIHPVESDVILGTHGRGIYIIDDITPLRHLTAEMIHQDVVFLKSRPAVKRFSLGNQFWRGSDEFVGSNPSDAATITYYMKKRHIFGDMRLEIYSPEGDLVSTLAGGKRAGINRVEWAMRLPPPKVPRSQVMAGGAFIGPDVPEGSYTLKLIKGKAVYTSTLDVIADPESPHSTEDRAIRNQTVWDLYNMLEDLAFTSERLLRAKEAAAEKAESLKRGGLKKSLEKFAEEAEELNNTFIATRGRESGISGEEKLREKTAMVYYSVVRFSGRPTQTLINRANALKIKIDEKGEEAAAFLDRELPGLNRKLEKEEIEPIVLLTREEWEKEKQK
ncbi:MAG TPA: glycosyl hydrolase [bacterium]|nr:glycosyl hydrolase [bacterium]